MEGDEYHFHDLYDEVFFRDDYTCGCGSAGPSGAGEVSAMHRRQDRAALRRHEHPNRKINEEIRRWEATAKFAEDEWMPSPEELDNPEPGTGGRMDVAMVAQLEAAKRINELLDEADQLIADFERQEAQLQAVRDGALPGNVDWSVCAS